MASLITTLVVCAFLVTEMYYTAKLFADRLILNYPMSLIKRKRVFLNIELQKVTYRRGGARGHAYLVVQFICKSKEVNKHIPLPELSNRRKVAQLMKSIEDKGIEIAYFE